MQCEDSNRQRQRQKQKQMVKHTGEFLYQGAVDLCSSSGQIRWLISRIGLVLVLKVGVGVGVGVVKIVETLVMVIVGDFRQNNFWVWFWGWTLAGGGGRAPGVVCVPMVGGTAGGEQGSCVRALNIPSPLHLEKTLRTAPHLTCRPFGAPYSMHLVQQQQQQQRRPRI
ncbi:hypothetical protein NA56DRAFT_696533 [Hyaloscypha hepaticicola]|uniref:Uncharacterized protein n=1 Tax=Hyaloscypha hepaticicola TaxID=2082293 RepID=A0A2J6QMP2_9HELO|nr:hypothetical protein NA56DRAFT_696533 [Hyaloscypha hepaticicola]